MDKMEKVEFFTMAMQLAEKYADCQRRKKETDKSSASDMGGLLDRLRAGNEALEALAGFKWFLIGLILTGVFNKEDVEKLNEVAFPLKENLLPEIAKFIEELDSIDSLGT